MSNCVTFYWIKKKSDFEEDTGFAFFFTAYGHFLCGTLPCTIFMHWIYLKHINNYSNFPQATMKVPTI